MSLIRYMLDRTFSDQIDVALFLNDKEVDVAGYQRVSVPRWALGDETAEATVKLGGYEAPFAYDRYVLFDGDQRIHDFKEDIEVALPTGWRWDYTLVVNIGT